MDRDSDGRTMPGRAAAVRRWPEVHWPVVAAGFACALAVGVVVALVVQATGDWARGLAWERALLLSLDTTLPAWADVALVALPWFGTNYTLLPIVLAASAWLWFRTPHRDVALRLLVVQLGSLALNLALKGLFDRPRPALWPKRGQFALASYPSGHAIASVAVLLTVALLLLRAGRRALAALVAAFVLLSLYSRLYLGVHWPTDVLGGVAVGSIWLWATTKGFAAAERDESR